MHLLRTCPQKNRAVQRVKRVKGLTQGKLFNVLPFSWGLQGFVEVLSIPHCSLGKDFYFKLSVFSQSSPK